MKVTKSESVELIKKAFPDANGWLDLFLCARRQHLSKSLVRELSYNHGVEKVTCDCCLLGDTEVLKYSVDYLKDHKDALKKKLKEYTQNHAINPHPAVLLKEFAQPSGPTKRPADQRNWPIKKKLKRR